MFTWGKPVLIHKHKGFLFLWGGGVRVDRFLVKRMTVASPQRIRWLRMRLGFLYLQRFLKMGVFWHRISFWDLNFVRSDPKPEAFAVFPFRPAEVEVPAPKARQGNREEITSLRVRMKVVPQRVPYVSRSWTFELDACLYSVCFCQSAISCFFDFIDVLRCGCNCLAEGW